MKLNFTDQTPASSSGAKFHLMESDHSNLSMSTLYSTDGETSKKLEGEKLLIDVSPTDGPKQSRYTAMTSPELKKLVSQELRNTVDSNGSESTYLTERSGRVDSVPTSPLRTTNNRLNDSILSPIKLLELADVCSERQSQEEQELLLSSQLSQTTTKGEEEESKDD